jgi:hypothetical protein
MALKATVPNFGAVALFLRHRSDLCGLTRLRMVW